MKKLDYVNALFHDILSYSQSSCGKEEVWVCNSHDKNPLKKALNK